jgi:hypothetical protein
VTALQTDLGVTGAKRQSWRRANPRDVLKRLIDKNPEMGEDELQAEAWDILHRDQQQMRTVFEYWFANNYRSAVKPKSSGGWQERAKTQELAAKIEEQLVQKVEATVRVTLLYMTLPSGKWLRDSTREELLELGGWTARVAKKLRPHQTVAQAGLTEEQLQALYGS